MSHNPNTVKSQDDLPTTNDGRRSSDVLLSTIEELEKVKKENELFKEIIKDEMIKNGEIIEEIEQLQKQLEIAVNSLKTVVNLACPYFQVKTAKADSFHQLKNIQKKCGIALYKIKELNK